MVVSEVYYEISETWNLTVCHLQFMQTGSSPLLHSFIRLRVDAAAHPIPTGIGVEIWWLFSMPPMRAC